MKEGIKMHTILHYLRKNLLTDIKTFLSTLVIALLLQHFFITPCTVKGSSMENTLMDQQKIMISRHFEIDHFDIVVLQAPDRKNKKYIKRVIGLPGDRLRYQNNQLYLNDQLITENYLSPDPSISYTKDFNLTNTIPEGYYFVLGDHRTKSWDSRNYGLVSQEEILGEAIFSFYPLNKISILE